MTVLITGASGFLGTEFVEYATLKFGAENIVLLTSKNIEGYKCILHNDYTFNKNDFVRKGISEIDILFHIGGWCPKNANDKSIDNIAAISTNVIYTCHLLENLPFVPKKIIYVSSISVYNNVGEIINEASPYTGNDLYGISKLMTEKVLIDFCNKYGGVLKILRLGPIYGDGNEKYETIVSSFLIRMIERKKITVYGDGSALRNNLYVKDAVKYIYLSGVLDFHETIINICSRENISINKLLQICGNIVGSNLKDSIFYDLNQNTRNIVFDTNLQESLFTNFDETPLEVGVKNLYLYLRDKNGNC